jgi:uncharacterized protein
MSEGLLPHTVSTRKAVTRGACYSGALGAQELPRLADVLDPENGAAVHASLRFGRDDEDRQTVQVETQATVVLECQRCLGRFPCELESRSELAIVRNDEEARQLPARYEPLLAGEETDLWEIVAEEVSLALPVVPLHSESECPVRLRDDNGGDADLEAGAGGNRRPNPFEALSALLDDSDDGSD